MILRQTSPNRPQNRYFSRHVWLSHSTLDSNTHEADIKQTSTAATEVKPTPNRPAWLTELENKRSTTERKWQNFGSPNRPQNRYFSRHVWLSHSTLESSHSVDVPSGWEKHENTAKVRVMRMRYMAMIMVVAVRERAREREEHRARETETGTER